MSDRIEELGPGVYRRRHDMLALNCGIVVGSEGVAVIDTRETPAAGADLALAVAGVTDLPIRWVVNTHWHWDHAWGNVAFPQAAIWGHTRCAEVLAGVGPDDIDEVKAWFRPERHHELDDLVIVPPPFVFDDLAFLDLGGRGLTLTFHGLAHTDADIVVGVTDAPVVFAGDIVEEAAAPYFGDGYPIDWVGTLDSLLVTEPAAIVPGHGDVVDLGFVRQQRDDIAFCVETARRCHAGDVPIDETPLAGSPFPPETTRELHRRAYRQLDETGPA